MTTLDQQPRARATPWLLTLAAMLLLGLAVSGALDGAGRTYADASLRRALLTFGVARTLNGLISVAQGTELALQPAGVGVTLAPGELLDPVNDLVERFSSIALLAATSLGIQRVLLDVAAWPPLTWALGIALLAALLSVWHPRTAGTRLARALWVLVAALSLLRFAAPAMTLTAAGLFEAFLAPRYAQATAQLEGTTRQLRALNEEEHAAVVQRDRSMLERARSAFDAASDTLDLRRRVDAFTAAAADVTDHTIDLIVVFVIETLLIPLALLWLLLAALRRLLAWAAGAGI